MTETETEHDRKVREYWANVYKTSASGKNPIYDIGSLDLTLNDDSDSNSNSKLPYEPTAVLNSPNPKDKRIRLRDMVNLDFSR